MSRSYRKHPIIKDSVKDAKREANKRVRRYQDDISNGKGYKKLYESWDISEYANRWSFEDFYHYALHDPEVLIWRKRYKKVEDLPELTRKYIYSQWRFRWLRK